jgi:phenylalanyl-tRNA synthetase beta chain
MQGNVRIFEIGAAFAPSGGVLPVEDLRVACLLMGDREPAHFTAPRTPVLDEWDAKWIAEQAARAAAPGAHVELRQAEGEPARLWDILVDGSAKGHVSALTLDAPVWAAPAFGIELSLGIVPSAEVAPRGEHAYGAAARVQPEAGYRPFRPLPTTPAAEFDLALLVREEQRAADVEAVIRGAAGDLLESLTLFDQYVGKGVAAGYRSLAWRVVLRHPERTLRDKEIEGRRAKILSTLQTELDVRPRAG